MPNLNLAGTVGALDHINATQAQFREQIAVLNDIVRQLAGNANVKAGNLEIVDPLSAPFTLYVNPYTGSDTFAAGPYNDYELGAGTDEAKIEAKLKRLEKQRLTCGYTLHRPFKTINRAVIEAAIITSKEWYTYTDPRAHVDCVSIVLSSGVHTVYNDPGNSPSAVTPASWSDGKNPTWQELIAFNPNSGGVLLPRGCSLCGADLRKVTIRPTYVPTPADEASNYSNRSAIFRMTGSGYFFGFTFMDKVNLNSSHHLLDGFQFASKADLDEFYSKIETSLGTSADLSNTLLATRNTEYKIVGPITGSPIEAWDTTASASPYVFNCSVRSNYGMGGIFADGSKVEGLKSIVTACFTGVSLQKDLDCWEIYNTENNLWEVCSSYATYIAADPDNVRMRPSRVNRHISAVNNAFIQEVSIFCIGQGIHHFTDSGGEITITNSNSSFGGCAAVSKGYKSAAFPQDSYWRIANLRVPLDVGQKTGNIQRIYLGTVSDYNSSTITLTSPLAASPESATVPELLASQGYTLKNGTYLWVENPLGTDWKTTLTASAWNSASPSTINTSATLTEGGTNAAVTTTNGVRDALGKRVYVRRLVDTRTPEERRMVLDLEQRFPVGITGPVARQPERNFVLQTSPNISGGQINATLSSTSEVLVVSNVYNGGPVGGGVSKTARVSLRSGSPTRLYANNTFYEAGTVVSYNNKKYISTDRFVSSTTYPDPEKWVETYVHMPTSFYPEDSVKQEAPILIFDTDTENNAASTTCGINWSTIYTSAGEVRDQYRAGTDYRAVQFFLSALGFADPHAVLIPRAEASRMRDPSNSGHFPTPPSGGKANGLGDWAVEFRRPSMLRLYGHAWEWAGYLNYSKAIPSAQQELSAQNKFSYYFTHWLGGRVVPTGSNEEGYAVSPQGLEDITTGTTKSVESLGSNSLRIPTTTSYPELTVETLNVTSFLNITASAVNVPDVMKAVTDPAKLGLVRLANVNQLNAQPGSADFKISNTNAEIEASPEAVTVGGLNQWRVANKLLSGVVSSVFIYVDPTAPVLSVDAMFENPPTVRERACGSIKRAAEFCAAAYPAKAVVQLCCKPGYYLNDNGIITFSNRMAIRSWDFTTNQPMTTAFNNTSGGTSYWNNTHIMDPTKACILFCQPYQSEWYTPPGGTLYNQFVMNPTSFKFTEISSVSGFSWMGPRETITSEVVPDSWFTRNFNRVNANSADPTNWRTKGKLEPEKAVFYWIQANIDANVGGSRDFLCRIGPNCISFAGGESDSEHWVSFCAVGPMNPFGQSTGGEAAQGALFYSNCPANVRFSGLYVWGNLRVDSSWNAGTAITYNGAQPFNYTGHCRSLFCGDASQSFKFNLGGFNEDRVYNQDVNNIHLMTNSRTYPVTPTASPAGNGYLDIGPGFWTIMDNVFDVPTAPFLFWHESNVLPGNYQGWKGAFGSRVELNGTIVRPIGIYYATNIDVQTLNHYVYARLWRVAGSGNTAEVTDAEFSAAFGALAAGGRSALINWDPLNIRVAAYKRGIDVNTARTVATDFVA